MMKTSMNKIVSLLVVFLLSVTSLWAANIPTGTKLYLKPNDNWKADKARFAAYFCNGSKGAKWVSMTKVGDNGYYEVEVPGTTTEYKNVIFVNM